VSLEQENGNCCLKTNVYELMGDFRTGIISSETLGCAFEPEQRFENPDGTGILFDTDYFGDHRGIRTVPGPFADTDRFSGENGAPLLVCSAAEA
ncbi:MAG: hypothetical protein J6S83_10315, partial [Lachnospiraceae bacterium]|nr:hypothetical protein [Lachnospiraceae bacterium]